MSKHDNAGVLPPLPECRVSIAVEAFLASASTGQVHPVTKLQRDLTTKYMRVALAALQGDVYRCDYCGSDYTDDHICCDRRREYLAHFDRAAEALRQSQSLPAGAVAGLAEDADRAEELARRLVRSGPKAAHVSASETHELSDWVRGAAPIIRALQADAREKGEALTSGALYHATNRLLARIGSEGEVDSKASEVVELMDILLSIDGGQYITNLSTDGCTESNCERCNTEPCARGDMRHAGIGSYPATQPAQASETIPEAKLIEAGSLVDGLGGQGSWAIATAFGCRVVNQQFARGWNECRALATSSQETASE